MNMIHISQSFIKITFHLVFYNNIVENSPLQQRRLCILSLSMTI